MGVQTTTAIHWARLRIMTMIAVMVSVIGPAWTVTATETRQDVDLLNGLVAYWPLDETSGVRYDAHASYDLTDNNTVGYTAGIIGNAASAAAAYNESLTKNGIINSDELSLSGWVKTEFSIVLEFDSGNSLISVSNSGNVIELYVDFGSETCEYNDSSSIVAANWNHVVFTHSNVHSETEVFVNGVPVASVDFNDCEYSPDTNYDLRIFDSDTGYADEFGMWDRIMTDSEIDALYNAGAGLPYSAFSQATPSGVSGVVSYWSMDEPSGTRYDSADGNDLTISGAPLSVEGRVGPAAAFDGSDDYLSMSDVFTDSESFSAIAWAGIDEQCETSDDCPIMGVWGSTYTAREWRVRYFAGFVNLDVQTESGITTLSLQATPNDWHMIGFAYDATAETCTLQVDSELETAACTDANMGTSTPMRFAYDGTGYLDGAIDESVILDGVYEAFEWDIFYNNASGISYDDLVLMSETHYAYFPLVMLNYDGAYSPDVESCDVVVCEDGYHCLNGECIEDDDIESIVPIDYKSASWREWADLIDELLAPIFKLITSTEESIEETNTLACGQIGPDDEFTPSSDEPTFYEGQTTLDRVYNMGLAMGKPMSYIRALNAAGVLGMNYLTVLMAYFGGVVLLFAFVGGVSLTVRIVRGAAQLIKWIYELIPFKST